MPDLPRNNIATCQVHKERPEFYFIPQFQSGLVVFQHNARPTVRLSIKDVLSECAKSAFLAFLPENSVPVGDIEWLREHAVNLDLTIIAGLEHKVAWSPCSAVGDYQHGAFTAQNRFVVLRPDGRAPDYGKKNFPARVMGHLVLEQIDRNPNPEFPFFSVRTPDNDEINVWPILCSDFLKLASERYRDELDAKIREWKIDIIAVLSHTHRPDAFRNPIERLIAVGTERSLPTNILFANFAHYGGSFCLAHNERKLLRVDDNTQFWKDRIIPKGEESFRLFTDWSSALNEARRAQKT